MKLYDEVAVRHQETLYGRLNYAIHLLFENKLIEKKELHNLEEKLLTETFVQKAMESINE